MRTESERPLSLYVQRCMTFQNESVPEASVEGLLGRRKYSRLGHRSQAHQREKTSRNCALLIVALREFTEKVLRVFFCGGMSSIETRGRSKEGGRVAALTLQMLDRNRSEDTAGEGSLSKGTQWREYPQSVRDKSGDFSDMRSDWIQYERHDLGYPPLCGAQRALTLQLCSLNQDRSL